jgi:hypothetical protein
VSVSVVLGMVLNLWLQREPRYQGKTVSAWADDLRDNRFHRHIQEAVAKIDSAAGERLGRAP